MAGPEVAAPCAGAKSFKSGGHSVDGTGRSPNEGFSTKDRETSAGGAVRGATNKAALRDFQTVRVQYEGRNFATLMGARRQRTSNPKNLAG